MARIPLSFSPNPSQFSGSRFPLPCAISEAAGAEAAGAEVAFLANSTRAPQLFSSKWF